MQQQSTPVPIRSGRTQRARKAPTGHTSPNGVRPGPNRAVKLAATLQQGQAAVAAIPSILNLTSIFRALRRSGRRAQTQIGPEWA